MATCQISIGRRIFPFDYPQKTGYFCGPFLEFWGSVRSEVSLRSGLCRSSGEAGTAAEPGT